MNIEIEKVVKDINKGQNNILEMIKKFKEHYKINIEQKFTAQLEKKESELGAYRQALGLISESIQQFNKNAEEALIIEE